MKKDPGKKKNSTPLLYIVIFYTVILILTIIAAWPPTEKKKSTHKVLQQKGRFEVFDRFQMFDTPSKAYGLIIQDKVSGKLFLYVRGDGGNAMTEIETWRKE